MEDVDRNTDNLCEWMERAVTGYPGIDMVVFPECCFQGMHYTEYPKVALTWDSEPIRRVCEKCKELQIWGVFNPWIKPEDGRFIENTAILVNDEGEIVAKYVKMNPWVPYEPTVPGRGVVVADGPKGTKIALMICADGKYQEIWRECRLQGANLVVHVSHWPAPYEYGHKLCNLAGAFFNRTPVLAVNSVGTDEGYVFCGGSLVVDAAGNVIKEAPLGIEWMLESAINPAAMVAGVDNAITSNLPWEFDHRGACCPDQDGIGLDASDYTAYMARLNQKEN
jgi:amidase/formamidase